jgi:ABC-type bacteriocin/lantibiotic exporter with double-glycine peptidase domain
MAARAIQGTTAQRSRRDPGWDGEPGFEHDVARATEEDHLLLATPYGRGNRRSNPLEACFMQLVIRLEPLIGAIEIQECLPDEDFFDELSFVNAFAQLGYTSTQLKLTPSDIDPRLLPCLFVPSARHSGTAGAPCVVISSDEHEGKRALSAYSSADGVVSQFDASDQLIKTVGTAYFFRKKTANDIATSKQLMADAGHTWFRRIAGRFTPVFWQLSLLGLLLNLLALASPLFVMLIYDRVISPKSTDAMLMLIIGVGLALAMELALRLLRTRLLSWLTARIHYIVGTEIFARLMELPPALMQRASVASQISRIKSFESVRDFFSGPIFVSTIEMPSMLIAIGLLLVIAPVLSLVPLLGAAAFVVTFFVLRHFIAVAIKAAATETSIVQQFSVETFQDREDIRGSGLTSIWKSKFREICGREHVAQARLSYLAAAGEHIAYALSILTGIFALYIGVELVWAGTITTGILVGSMILIWRAISPFYSLCSQIARFEQFRNSVRQINALMSMETEAEVRRASARLPRILGRIEFHNVGLRYSRQSGVIFLGLNANIREGEVIGVCGAIGSGKTSLLNLVHALVQPHVGRVSIDGFNVQQLSARDLRRQIAYVPQGAQAVPGSIAENLRISRPTASNADLWRAIEAVGAANLIKSLPGGLQYALQPHLRDQELLHRLAIARVVLQDARIILMDDIPGRLLNTGLGEVLGNLLENASGQRTILFVSQRMDFLRRADRVIGLRHGSIPLVGSLDKVLESTI